MLRIIRRCGQLNTAIDSSHPHHYFVGDSVARHEHAVQPTWSIPADTTGSRNLYLTTKGPNVLTVRGGKKMFLAQATTRSSYLPVPPRSAPPPRVLPDSTEVGVVPVA